MDGLKARGQFIVIGTTNRQNTLVVALRRFVHFERELDIGVPDETSSLKILCIHTKNMKLSEDCDLTKIAHDTDGHVDANLHKFILKQVYNV